MHLLKKDPKYFIHPTTNCKLLLFGILPGPTPFPTSKLSIHPPKPADGKVLHYKESQWVLHVGPVLHVSIDHAATEDVA